MQLLRDVELNTRQIINFRASLQAQVTRAIAALGMKDIRQLRGRYEYLEWQSLEERVRSLRHQRSNLSFDSPSAGRGNQGTLAEESLLKEPIPSPSDCGVAAIVSNRSIPSHVMDLMLDRMANRGMDGVGIWKEDVIPLIWIIMPFIYWSRGSFKTMSRQNTSPVISAFIPERSAKGQEESVRRPPGDHEGDHGKVF